MTKTKRIKKERTEMLSRRFNGFDIGHWQNMANVETGGNLTLWIELTLNKALKSTK